MTESPSSRSLPLLLLVSGMPASGKSTLAERLADELGVPCFTKDGFKELLFDAGSESPESLDEASSEVLGAQAIALLFHSADRLLSAETPVILEANFRAERTARQIGPLLERADVRQVHCYTPIEQITERFEQLQDEGERHPVHASVDDVEALERDLARKDYGPVPLDIPTLIVDTTDGFDPPFADIVAFCRARRRGFEPPS